MQKINEKSEKKLIKIIGDLKELIEELPHSNLREHLMRSRFICVMVANELGLNKKEIKKEKPKIKIVKKNGKQIKRE